MSIILLLLSLTAAGGAAVLWAAAARQEARSAAAPVADDASDCASDGATDTVSDESTEATEFTEPTEPTERAASAETAAFDIGKEEIDPDTDQFPAQPRVERDPEATAPDADTEDSADTEDTESELLPERKPLLPPLPGAARRERREWATARGYEFFKHDEYLVDEFTRGAASTGAAPRDIAAGQVLGHEMLLMDLGPVTVMAMRTGAASDVVVDFRRQRAAGTTENGGGETASASEGVSEDLLPAGEVEGFAVYATEPGVAERMIDPRVTTALAALPQEVTAVWLESEWALAQLAKDVRPRHWDALQAPLAMLADAARVLPPRPQAAQVLRLEDGDPSRAMEQSTATLAHGPVLVAPPVDEVLTPPVQRPEEPVELPTRIVGTAKGHMHHSALGADEVDAIADGRERPEISDLAPRIRRKDQGGSSIFGDER